MANNVRATVGVKDNASTELDRIKGKFTALQKQGAKGFAIGAGAAVTAKAINAVSVGLDGVVNAAFDAIRSASALNETMSKSEVVFGKAAGKVAEFGDHSAKSLGISKQAAVEAAATFGNLFVGLKLGEDKAAEMSTTLVKLAGDLASFNNLDPAEALLKLRSGLAGEAEPLRSLGVFLNEAKVKAKAMQLGLAGANGELSEGAKVQARYALILEETTTAQGDFARTADGMANQQRILNAMMEDTSAELGQNLIPLVIDAQQAIIGLSDGVKLLGTATEATAAESRDLFDSMIEGAKGLGPFANWFASVAENISNFGMEARNAADDSDRLSRKERSLGGRFEALADTVDETTRNIKHDWTSMVEKVRDETQTLLDDTFDPLETQYEILEARSALHAAETERDSAKTKEAYDSATSDIISALDDQGQGLIDLSKHGKLTAKDVDRFATDARREYQHMSKEARADIQSLIAKLRELASIDGVSVNAQITHGDRGKNAKGGKASGGPAFGRTLVGEQGPEWLDLPSGSFVHDAKKTRQMGPGGGGDIFNITFTGPVGGDQNNLLRQVDRARRVAANRKVA